MHITALSRTWFTIETPAADRPLAISEPITMAPELTILFAAMVREVWVLSTKVVRKA